MRGTWFFSKWYIYYYTLLQGICVWHSAPCIKKLQTAIATTKKYIYAACLRAEAAEKQEKHIGISFKFILE
jgi:hypothetical protein